MELFSIKPYFFTSLVFYLSLSSLFLSLPPPTQAITPPPEAIPPTQQPTTSPSGTIQRSTKQQILVTIPPNTAENSQPFITSPSGKYTGYLLRRETALGAGGFGNDFCYVQVQDLSSGQSVWESDCSPVSNVNSCSLVFDDSGLEVFDGSRSTWDTNADGDHLETLELVDEGDMRIRDQNGDVSWKASDQPQANQQCGSPGSPGLAPAKPPFASPIQGNKNLPFGQQASGNQRQPNTVYNQQQQPLGFSQQQIGNGFGQTYGANGQPLVDNTPFDSGCSRAVDRWFGLLLAPMMVAYGFLLV